MQDSFLPSSWLIARDIHQLKWRMNKENEEGWRKDAIIKEQFKSGTGAHLCIQYQYFTFNVTIMSAAPKRGPVEPRFFRSTEYIYYLNAIEVYAPY
jgi:hypothetical protein